MRQAGSRVHGKAARAQLGLATSSFLAHGMRMTCPHWAAMLMGVGGTEVGVAGGP